MGDVPGKCAVCGSLLDEEDLFCANCGTEAPRQQAEAPAGAPAARPGVEPSRVSKDNFECSGCGASMSYDAGAEALRCPFCGSVEMVAKPDSKVLTPSLVVPFQVGREEAERKMRNWLGRGVWRPTGLSQEAAVVKIAPVYVPYWVFQAKTHTYWTADTDQAPPGARAGWYPLSGEHRGSYSGLLIGASGALAAAETWALCPFDLTPGVPSDKVDLDNVIVEQFSLPKKYARPLAREGLEQMETEACTAAYVPGTARNVHVNVRITEMIGEPVLLPVWIMAYRFRDKVYRFLANGQTGRVTGQAPISYLKIAATIAILLLILALLGLLAVGLGKVSAMVGVAAGFLPRAPAGSASRRPSSPGEVSGILSGQNVKCKMQSAKCKTALHFSFCILHFAFFTARPDHAP